jgi:O-antigen/teichoic acid export membrane protein
VTIPVITFQILFAEPLINLIYGPKWHDAVIPFQILSLFVLFKSVGSPTSGLYNATGNPQVGFYFLLIFTPVFIGTVLLSSIFRSLIITTIIVSVIRIIGTFVHFFLSGKIVKISGFILIKESLKSIIPVIILLIPIILSRLFVPRDLTICEMIFFLMGYIYLFVKLLPIEWYNLKDDIQKLLPLRMQRVIQKVGFLIR